jgi:hypothetical protein
MKNKKKTLLNSVRNVAIAGAIAFGLGGDVDGQITPRQQTGQRVAVEAGQTLLTLKINDKIVIDGKEFRVVDLEGDAHIVENTKTLELEEVDNSVIHKVLSEKKVNEAPKKESLSINDKIVIKGVEYLVVDRQKDTHILKNLKTGEYEKVKNSVISEVLAGKTNDAPKKENLGINDKIVIKGIEYLVVDRQKDTHILKNTKTGEYEKVNNSVISEVLTGKTNDAPKKESFNDEVVQSDDVILFFDKSVKQVNKTATTDNNVKSNTNAKTVMSHDWPVDYKGGLYIVKGYQNGVYALSLHHDEEPTLSVHESELEDEIKNYIRVEKLRKDNPFLNGGPLNKGQLENQEEASTGHQVLVDRFGKGDPVILTLDINDEIVIGGQKYKVVQRKEDSHILKNIKTGALKEFDDGVIDDAMIEKRFGNPKNTNSGNNNGQRKPKSSRYQNKGRRR